jgi:hypothetical protein
MTGEQRKRLLQEEAAAVLAVHHDKQVRALCNHYSAVHALTATLLVLATHTIMLPMTRLSAHCVHAIAVLQLSTHRWRGVRR